jgi:putative ABC transport system substrate-binding protein
MKRREFIALVGGTAAWPVASLAQVVAKIRRIGFLRVGQPPPAFIGNLRQGLRDLGLVEGQHFVFEFPLARSVRCKCPRLPQSWFVST